MRKEELAWAAGIVDGEGCISVERKRTPRDQRNPSYRLRLRVGMGHQLSIERLFKIFAIGTVKPIKRRANRRPHFIWSCSGDDAYKVLFVLRPFLFTKKTQAILGIRFREYVKSLQTPGCRAYSGAQVQRQHDFYTKIRLAKIKA